MKITSKHITSGPKQERYLNKECCCVAPGPFRKKKGKGLISYTGFHLKLAEAGKCVIHSLSGGVLTLKQHELQSSKLKNYTT